VLRGCELNFREKKQHAVGDVFYCRVLVEVIGEEGMGSLVNKLVTEKLNLNLVASKEPAFGHFPYNLENCF